MDSVPQLVKASLVARYDLNLPAAPTDVAVFMDPNGPAFANIRLPRGQFAHGNAEQSRAQQRARAIWGLVNMVADLGYANATVGRICAHAGISKKTFYDLFAGKEECYLCAYRAGHQALVMAILAGQPPNSSWDQRVELGIRTYLDFFSKREAGTLALMGEVYSAGANAITLHHHALDRLAHLVRNLYQQSKKDRPDLPDLPLDVFEYLTSGMGMLTLNALHRGRVKSLVNELFPVCVFVTMSVFSGSTDALAHLKPGIGFNAA